MDRFWTFIQGMTLFNWLTVIAFIFFPLSALNALLSLKSRYLDWSGTRNVNKFNSRLEELMDEWQDIQRYNRNLPKFFLQLLEDIIRPLICLFGSLTFFIGAFAISEFHLPIFRLFEFVYLGLAVSLTLYGMHLTQKKGQIIRAVHQPDYFVRRVIDFIGDGKRKRFIPMEPNDFIDSLLYSDLFDDETLIKLQAYWATDEFKTAQKIFIKV